MSKAGIAPFGTWHSPITPQMIAQQSVLKDDVLVDPQSSTLYHIEIRPEEGGRNAVVESEAGSDLFGRSWSARTRVHEYGGASAVIFGGNLIFSNVNDGQVYVQKSQGNEDPKRITSNPAHRFADFSVHPIHRHLVVCILEDHTHDVAAEVVTTLVVINTRTGNTDTLLSGADFFSYPRFNEDGTFLTWCQWNHPDMPWDGSQLFLSGVRVVDDKIILAPDVLPTTRLGGEPGNVSAVQPTWLNTRTLIFSSDVSGYQNPWIAEIQQTPDTKFPVISVPLFPTPIDQDFVDSPWYLGTANIAVLDESTLLFSASKDGRHQFYVVGMNGSTKEIECPYVHITRLKRVSEHQVAFLGTKDDKPQALIKCSFDAHFAPTYSVIGPDSIHVKLSSTDLSTLISLPRPMTLEVSHPLASGNDKPNSRYVHILFFPPLNPAYIGPKDAKPPAIVNVHGGPTLIEWRGLKMVKQFFTSRGWAWIDVNYGGSSNYGRQYAQQLKGNWGLTDVEDCAYAVKELSSHKHGLIDPERVVIRGGSAGG